MQITNSEKMLLAQYTIDQLQKKTILRLQFDAIVPLIEKTKSIIVGILVDGTFTNYTAASGLLHLKLQQEIERALDATIERKEPYLENFGNLTTFGFITIDLISFHYDIDYKTRSRTNSPAKAAGYLFDFNLNGFD